MLRKLIQQAPKGLGSNSILFATTLSCSALSIADSSLTAIQGPTQLLPQVFSRIDYVAAPDFYRSTAAVSKELLTEQKPNSLQEFGFIEPLNNNASRHTDYAARTPAPRERAPTGPAISSQEYANEDLDLALENFFYALEDLIQSAARQANTSDTENSYVAQVQFPTNVMASANSYTPAANTPAVAQSATLPPVTVDAENLGLLSYLDNFKFNSNLSVNVEHNDNIYTTRGNRISDTIARASANGTLESKDRKRAIKFEGSVNAGAYREFSEDNYAEFSGTGSYSTLLSQRSKAFVGLGYFVHHEDRGEGSSDGDNVSDLTEPVEFGSWVARGIYERGTQRTRARFTADAKVDQLRTLNFREIDAIRGRDRDINSIITTAFYNWSQRMALLVELRHQDIEYVNTTGADSLDSTQTRYALGAEWLATRKTAGSVRVGFQDKDFDSSSEFDNSNISWEAIVEWTPGPRTEMVFETASDIEESDGFGTSRDRTDYKITWKQKWTPRINTQTSAQYGVTDYQDQQREDELSLVNAVLSYSVNSSTNASLKLTYVDNNSNVTEYSFDRSQIQLGVDMEF